MQSDIFRQFCHYVDEHIFSKDNMGSYVALVVNQSFVDDFCKEFHTTESALMTSVRNNLWNNRFDHISIKGIVAIQLFAASKRANKDGLTVKNYRDRLSQVVDWDITDLQRWMSAYQENIWLSLYDWCDRNFFQITQCKPRTGTGRYVQYPVNQALRVFTDEDLFYIARIFADSRLYPGEDVSQIEFWRIINRFALSKYIVTRHAIDVIDNSVSEEDYLSQIYSFYLRWNGKYKIREKITRIDSTVDGVFAYLTDDFQTLELRNEQLQLLYSFASDQMKYSDVQAHFHFKREGLLLFKRDDIYENRWQEIRYIDADENDYSKNTGNYCIAICFRNVVPFQLEYKLKRCEILFENKNVVIYKLVRYVSTEEFFSTKRIYELYGGLKIGRNTYIKGALPMLRLSKPSMIWIDGNPMDDLSTEGNCSLNHLGIGTHFIKMLDSPKIKIVVVDASASMLVWRDCYNKWQISKKPALWQSTRSDSGIVGLNYSSISDKELAVNGSVTRRWAKALVFGLYNKNEDNIAINLTR